MIRAIRPSAVAQDDASLVSGWNIAPNVGYTVSLSVSASAVVVILANADGATLIGSGLALVGTDQPVTITPVSGQTINMVDVDLGWHLLVTTAGTEGERTITLDPMVDLADEIHPIYTDSDMALARATAAINAGTSYVDDVTVTCPLGIGAGIGSVTSVAVDGAAVVGQVESITWSGTPDGTSETAVIRRHTPIAPEAYEPPLPPPILVDDTAETDAVTAASGNVLANDTGTLTVVAVNGLSVNVGEEVAGSNGGVFVIGPDGSWTFDPAGDFAGLSGSDTTLTSVSYHASNGSAEASATLTVTVSSADAVLWTPAEITTAQWFDADDESTITLNGAAVSQWADKSGNTRHAVQVAPTAQPALVASGRNGRDIVVFDGTSDTLPHGFALTSNICSLFVVASVGEQVGYRGIYTTNGANATNIMMLARGGTSNWGTYYSTTYRPSNTNIQGAGWQILEMLRGGISGAYMRNGSADGSFSGSEGQNGAIGGNAHSSQFCDLSVAEIILLPTNPDETTRQKIEGYLAHKWGLTVSLPTDHPYKSAAPTI